MGGWLALTQQACPELVEGDFHPARNAKFAWRGLDGNAARLVLGFSSSSIKFPDGPQPDSHNPRFRKPPLSSRTVGSPESGWRHSTSSETLPIQPETQVLVHIRPLVIWFDF